MNASLRPAQPSALLSSFRRLPPSSTPTCPLYRFPRMTPTRRTFSTSHRCRAVMPSASQSAASRAAQPRIPTTQGQRSRLKEAVDLEKLPLDLGLFPATFVRPLPENMPGWFSDWRNRWRMEWTWFRSKLEGLGSTIVFAKWLSKPRIPLRFKERKEAAKSLHSEMYTAFAKGNIPQLKTITYDGLFKNFSQQIASRKERLIWTLHGYKKTHLGLFPLNGAAVISDRATMVPLPGISLGIRQVVVRICSEQSIDRVLPLPQKLIKSTKKPEVITGPTQTITEYVVLQKAVVYDSSGSLTGKSESVHLLIYFVRKYVELNI